MDLDELLELGKVRHALGAQHYESISGTTSQCVEKLVRRFADLKTDRESLIEDAQALRRDKEKLWERKTELESEAVTLREEAVDMVRSRYRGVGSELKILHRIPDAKIVEVELHPELLKECRSLRTQLTEAAARGERPFNINHDVWVRLTDRGREILAKQHEELSARVRGTLGDYTPVSEDADGWSKWQMWCLMSELGQACHMGPTPPFETNIRFKAPSPTPPAAAEGERSLWYPDTKAETPELGIAETSSEPSDVSEQQEWVADAKEFLKDTFGAAAEGSKTMNDSETIDLLCELVTRLILEVAPHRNPQMVADIDMTGIQERAERAVVAILGEDSEGEREWV